MVKIVQDGDPVLREIAKPVPEELFGSAKLNKIIEDMTAALDRELEGVALAAPQIGISYRLFIVRKDRTLPFPTNVSGRDIPKRAPEVEVYVNPKIIKTSRRRATVDEGCLSTRGLYGIIKRHERVTISARLPDGSSIQRGSGGLMAQIFEHEIDHLNGILFTDSAEKIVHITHDNHEPASS